MTTPSNAPTAGARGPSLGPREWIALTALSIVLWAALVPGRPSAFGMFPQTAGDASPEFVKAGKTYVNMRMVTHVVEDPGQNLPQNALEVHFASASLASNVIYVFGDDAEAIRAQLGGQSGTHATAPGTKPAAKGALKRPPAARKAPNALPPSQDPG
jgi:hypothetical protein